MSLVQARRRENFIVSKVEFQMHNDLQDVAENMQYALLIWFHILVFYRYKFFKIYG